MSPEWLAEVYQAASKLKGKKVRQLIQQMPSSQEAIANQLQTFADNYQFDEIVELLSSSGD
ncbi:MAG: hypothetical protein ACFBSC_07120 [Microcoleaceae cyanobacterium]